jgi:acetoin utilization protein AcuB
MVLQVQDLMVTNLFIAHVEQSLNAAYRAMVDNKIRHLPVINEHKKLVGLISERDLERAMVSVVFVDSEGRRIEDLEFPSHKKVKDYMTTNLVTVGASNSVLYAIELMRELKISSVLIAENNVMKGILTTDDLLHLLSQIIREDQTQRISILVDKGFEDSYIEMSG